MMLSFSSKITVEEHLGKPRQPEPVVPMAQTDAVLKNYEEAYFDFDTAEKKEVIALMEMKHGTAGKLLAIAYQEGFRKNPDPPRLLLD